jgi:hypothetical protein
MLIIFFDEFYEKKFLVFEIIYTFNSMFIVTITLSNIHSNSNWISYKVNF